ncbi:MAG: DUF7935 family protein [Lutibacter sp.]
MLSKLPNWIMLLLPSAVTAILAAYFFKSYSQSLLSYFKTQINNETANNTQLKLQAYERLLLFLERIKLNQLVMRVDTVNNDKNAYALSLVKLIEEEFNHNLTQQLFISDTCWKTIVNAKNTTIQTVNSIQNKLLSPNTAQQFRIELLNHYAKNNSPINDSINILKKEAKGFI